MTALPSEPVNGTKPPAIAACPPPFRSLQRLRRDLAGVERRFFTPTDSLMPSLSLSTPRKKETSTSASIKSETLAINASRAVLPVSAKLILSYTSMLEIALNTPPDPQNTGCCSPVCGSPHNHSHRTSDRASRYRALTRRVKDCACRMRMPYVSAVAIFYPSQCHFP